MTSFPRSFVFHYETHDVNSFNVEVDQECSVTTIDDFLCKFISLILGVIIQEVRSFDPEGQVNKSLLVN